MKHFDKNNLTRGARIIAQKWMDLRKKNSVLIITEAAHEAEMQVLKACAENIGAKVQIELLPGLLSPELLSNELLSNEDIDSFFRRLADKISSYDVIVGATYHSIVTTELVQQAVKGGASFLSLPLATNDGRSLLEYDFLQMDTAKSRFIAKELLKYINTSSHLRVSTLAGTDLTLRKVGRNGNYFNGKAKDSKGFASSSFEVYIPIEEDRTEGIVILDGSLGYLGRVDKPFKIRFKGGRIVEIEQSPCGQRLANYIADFSDEKLYHASEFGIGTNFLSKCMGNSYIEDESAYGTCHLGFGRNLALGGEFNASGHFDIILLAPTIYADNRMIMENGVMIPAVLDVCSF